MALYQSKFNGRDRATVYTGLPGESDDGERLPRAPASRSSTSASSRRGGSPRSSTRSPMRAPRRRACSPPTGYSGVLDRWRSFDGNHSQAVARLAVELARTLGVDGEELEHVHLAALLHDIGKIAVPEHILNKAGAADRGRAGARRAPLADRLRARPRPRPLARSTLRAPPPRALGRRRLPARPRGRRDPLRLAADPRRGRLRRADLRPLVPLRRLGRGGDARAPGRERPPVRPARRRGARTTGSPSSSRPTHEHALETEPEWSSSTSPSLALVLGKLLGGRLSALADTPIRGKGLAFAAIGLQLVAFPSGLLPWSTPSAVAQRDLARLVRPARRDAAAERAPRGHAADRSRARQQRGRDRRQRRADAGARRGAARGRAPTTRCTTTASSSPSRTSRRSSTAGRRPTGCRSRTSTRSATS